MAGIISAVESKSMSRKASGPRGDLLADRIRNDLTGCVAEQTAIALQIARTLHKIHRNGEYHGQISSSCIHLDENNLATLEGPLSNDKSFITADIRGLGLALYELFAGKILEGDDANRIPDLEPLYKAGITPRLVEIVKMCMVTPDLHQDLSESVKELESLLRQMLGEPARPRNVNAVIVVAAIAVSAVAGALWMFVR